MYYTGIMQKKINDMIFIIIGTIYNLKIVLLKVDIYNKTISFNLWTDLFIYMKFSF